MDKFLFTDGTSGVRVVHSLDELRRLLHNLPSPDHARIWLYNTGEWIPYASFIARYQQRLIPETEALQPSASRDNREIPVKKKKKITAPALMLAIAAGAVLVFNFASAKWISSGKILVTAARPANVPFMDADSLVKVIEFQRGRPVDKNTRNNLRLRNNWPEQIRLQLEASRETRNGHHRFSDIVVQIDNATGYPLDMAIVTLQGWKNGKPVRRDTIRFGRIGYDKANTRNLANSWQCDSLSISFSEIRSSAFNFCYAALIPNPSGNHNDRWFCREGRPAQ